GCGDPVEVPADGMHRYAAGVHAEGFRTCGAIDGDRIAAAVPVERDRAAGGRERSQINAIEADLETRRGDGREDERIVAKRTTDGERVPLELDNANGFRQRDQAADAKVLIHRVYLDRVSPWGGIGVTQRGAGWSVHELEKTVTPVDTKEESGGLVHGRGVAGRHGKVARLTRHAVRGTGDRRRRGHVVHGQEERGGGRHAVIVGGG